MDTSMKEVCPHLIFLAGLLFVCRQRSRSPTLSLVLQVRVWLVRLSSAQRRVTNCYGKILSACCFGEEPPYEAICCNKVEFYWWILTQYNLPNRQSSTVKQAGECEFCLRTLPGTADARTSKAQV